MVQYFVACERELWFFYHNINLNEFDENVRIGRLIHEKSHSREKKNVVFDDTISIDFIEGGSKPVVFEIKKSSKLEEPVRHQVYYYLWYLKHKKGIETHGVISYPKERKQERIELTEEIECRLEKMFRGISAVIKCDKPPKAIKKPYCRRCSYFEFCWV